MDDEDEVRDLNLSSRPLREERRRVREREKLERGMARINSSESASGSRPSAVRASWPANGSRQSGGDALSDASSTLERDAENRSLNVSRELRKAHWGVQGFVCGKGLLRAGCTMRRGKGTRKLKRPLRRWKRRRRKSAKLRR